MVKKNKVYHLRIRIPKDISPYFPFNELKRSLHTSTYKQASSLVKSYVAEAEKVFTMIRSKTLTTPMIFKIVEKYLDNLLSDYEKEIDTVLREKHEHEEIQKYAIENADRNIKKNKEFLAKNKYVEARQKKAVNILEKNEIVVDKDSPEFRELCKELVLASITMSEVLKSRLTGDQHPYDVELRNRKKSNTLQDVMEGYLQKSEKINKYRSLAKLPEKFKKIIECFEYETNENVILLSNIDNNLTLKVAERLKKYPSYRFARYPDKTLDEIYKMNDVQYSSYTTVEEEIKLLSALFTFALKRFDGLDRNFADDISKEILGKVTEMESECRDVFRPEDIKEILKNLIEVKRKNFHSSPHLFLIPLIALYSGMRVNEICQLYVEDIKQIGGMWCFDNNENHLGKSLKNTNSKRINPIHHDLVEIGLISFCESQKKKGMTLLWQGVRKISCDYYEIRGSHSHYFDKWFNGTFKKKLKLSNPEKQTFHSFRHTFINWFNQNSDLEGVHWNAVQALSGHLDDDEMKALGIDPKSPSRKVYSKELNVRKQYDTLKLIDYGIDINELKIEI